ncbi:MAG: ATP synthase F1 subunit delta [Nitrospirae bacterium]|nr:MAG: ATP synthase F1 subunit delta [Nitrospirota bacterium]
MATKKAKQAKKYARMLLNAVGLEEADRVIAQLSCLSEAIQEDKDLKNFFMSPSVSDEELEKGVEALSQKIGASEQLKRFLSFVAKKRLMGIIDDILRIYIQMSYDKKRKAKAVVRTVVPVNGGVSERLRAALQRITGRDVELEFIQEPELLGGMVVQVGSTMYDNSLKGQLRLLKEELIKG